MTSLPGLFFDQAQALRGAPFLLAKRARDNTPLKTFAAWSWDEVAAAVTALANGLAAIGIHPGDRVVLVSENRPEWCIADLAVMTAGAITVPAYTTNTANDHLHILNDCQASAVIVSTGKLARQVLHAATQMSHPPQVVLIDPTDLHQNPGLVLHRWADLMALGEGKPAPAPLHSLKRGDTACIIYTSGTGGAPKGVELSHGAIITNSEGPYRVLKDLGVGQEVFLSFLPLSHAYEHTAGQFFPMSLGAQIYYAEGLEALGTNLQEARPTIMTAVPRLYEVLRQKILRGVQAQGGLKEKLFLRTVSIGMKRQCTPASLTLTDHLLDPLLTLLVRRKVAGRFGGRLKAFVSGGAPLNADVGHFFTALGVRILQGYGQTEASPVISVNVPASVKMDTVGLPLYGVSVKLAEDGEICVRGETVMKGYWNNPEATAAVIDADGWLHTGDIGTIDSLGRLKITDRKKDIIVNSGGDNVSPQRVEGFLTLEPEIAQAMVYGDRRPHLVALIVPDPDFIQTFLSRNGLEPMPQETLIARADFRAAISEAVSRVNRDLSNIEKVRKFVLAPAAFTTDNGMLTPTLKIRRHVIRQHYATALDALYE
ncbi:AMP-dependent synthetase/ligase [Novispirillum itersonii]